MNDPAPVHIQVDDSFATVSLNRPDQHNAFNPDMVKALTSAFTNLSMRLDVRAIVLTGNGRSFCAGADLASMRDAANFTYQENLDDAQGIVDLMAVVNDCPHPVIGRINGAAIGGGVGLVSCCDIAVAVSRAKFAFSEVRLGLVPAVISPFVIAKIGQSSARELFLTGQRFDAHRAKEIGLVHYVVGETELDAKIREILQMLQQSAPGAVRAAKRMIRDVSRTSYEEARILAVRLIADRRATDEGKEGTTAFLEKREPWWRRSE
jgi:methylglutaconyl-CoA hydratase